MCYTYLFLHLDQIIKALEKAGYCPVITKTNGIYM